MSICREQPRTGDWIQTFSGRQFWPLDPRTNELDLVDIASALSKDCRYGGHCLQFYSVAEHCVLMTREARRRGYSIRDQRTTLLHDGSEGYLRDVPRPIKGDLTNYRTIEDGLMERIALRFDVDWPIPPHVKALDEEIVLAEQAQNMAPVPAPWRTGRSAFKADTPMDVQLRCWPPHRAFSEFMIEAANTGAMTA